MFYFIYAVTYTVIGSNTKIIFKVFARKKVILFRDITTFKLRAYYYSVRRFCQMFFPQSDSRYYINVEISALSSLNPVPFTELVAMMSL